MKSVIFKALLGLGIFLVVAAIGAMVFVRLNVEPGDRDENGKPPRAAGIPADHEWYGGFDGGNWIHCDPKNDYKEFYCSLYAESGSLLAKGTYVPSRSIVPPYEFRWSGESSINMKDQQAGDLVLLADGWIESADGKSFYRKGELSEAP